MKTSGYNLNSSMIACILPSHSNSGISKVIPSQEWDKGNAPNNSSRGLIYSQPYWFPIKIPESMSRNSWKPYKLQTCCSHSFDNIYLIVSSNA